MITYDHIKRGLDIAIAVPALIATAPVQVVIAIAVHRQLGSPVLFRQMRPGQHGEPFALLKFRSMRNATYLDEPDADRMTELGSFLRSTSLDELPSLINVLRGDMSIIGPRPLLMEYLDLYTPEQQRRHEVRPGVTGLAQVSGRNATTWKERFEYDTIYVDQRSVSLDARILARTLLTVLRRDGINADGQATMPRYTGDTPDTAGSDRA